MALVMADNVLMGLRAAPHEQRRPQSAFGAPFGRKLRPKAPPTAGWRQAQPLKKPSEGDGMLRGALEQIQRLSAENEALRSQIVQSSEARDLWATEASRREETCIGGQGSLREAAKEQESGPTARQPRGNRTGRTQPTARPGTALGPRHAEAEAAQSEAPLITRRKTPLWKLGTKVLLERGVKRAETPMERTFISKKERKLLPKAYTSAPKLLPPGVQKIGEQRGAGEQGAMRIGGSCINFAPSGSMSAHRRSFYKSSFSRTSLGLPPSRVPTAKAPFSSIFPRGAAFESENSLLVASHPFNVGAGLMANPRN